MFFSMSNSTSASSRSLRSVSDVSGPVEEAGGGGGDLDLDLNRASSGRSHCGDTPLFGRVRPNCLNKQHWQPKSKQGSTRSPAQVGIALLRTAPRRPHRRGMGGAHTLRTRATLPKPNLEDRHRHRGRLYRQRRDSGPPCGQSCRTPLAPAPTPKGSNGRRVWLCATRRRRRWT